MTFLVERVLSSLGGEEEERTKNTASTVNYRNKKIN